MDDWYNLSVQSIEMNRGEGLLTNYYDNTLSKALQNVYPEHKWCPWKFKVIPKGYLAKKENQREFMEWLGKQLGYKCLEDWYKVTKEALHKSGAHGFLRRHFNDSPSRALQSIYPEHKWEPWKFYMPPMGYWKSKENH